MYTPVIFYTGILFAYNMKCPLPWGQFTIFTSVQRVCWAWGREYSVAVLSHILESVDLYLAFVLVHFQEGEGVQLKEYSLYTREDVDNCEL
jgi:Sec-independent protein secretion pathway component TatC